MYFQNFPTISYDTVGNGNSQLVTDILTRVVVRKSIRDTQSFEAGNIPKSINISDNNIDNFLANTNRDVSLLVYCYVGNSSKGASDYFVQNGFKTVFSLDGGYEEYSRKNE